MKKLFLDWGNTIPLGLGLYCDCKTIVDYRLHVQQECSEEYDESSSGMHLSELRLR